MRSFRHLRLLGWLLPLFVQACASQYSDQDGSPREAVRWILVERRYADVVQTTDTGDGEVNPDAVVLAFQPLFPEDLKWEVAVDPDEHFVELVGFAPAGPAAPGEVVSATVRVGKAKDGLSYRLQARPSRQEVTIVGPDHALVTGSGSAVFRFTSRASGRCGIAVGLEVVGTGKSTRGDRSDPHSR